MEILTYKPINKNYLLGFFDLKVPKWGDCIIHGMSLFQKDGRRWINFPSKQYEKDGETKYFAYIQFEDKEMAKAFGEQVIHALDDYFKLNPKEEKEEEGIPF